MNNNSITKFLLSIFFIVAMIAYWLLPKNDFKVTAQYTVLLFSLGIACAAGLYSIKKYGTNSPKSITLYLLTGGMFCWLVGEALWTYYESVLHINPFPSSADVFYIVAYPMFFVALLRELLLTKVNWRILSKSLIFLMIISSIFLIVIVGYFGVYLAYSPQESILTNSIAIGYGLADGVLIITSMALLVLAWEFRGGNLSKIWFSLFISFILTLIADILFAIFTNSYDAPNSIYRSLTDSIWILSYLLFGYALFNFGFSIQSAHELLNTLMKKRKNH